MRPRLTLTWLALPLVAALGACGGEAVPSGFPAVVLEVGLETVPGSFAALPVAKGLPPTFRDGARQAWTLESLFARVRVPGPSRVEVVCADGQTMPLERPWRQGDRAVWALRTNRRGEAQVALVDPQDPFPAGGGASAVRAVARIRIVVDPQRESPGASEAPPTAPADDGATHPLAGLEVEIDGVVMVLGAEAASGLEPVKVRGDGDRGERDAWTLRSLVRTWGGERARLVSVLGEGESRGDVDPAAWEAPDRVPLLRLNRRGQLKFHWATADLKPQGGGEVRGVRRLVIASR